MIPAIDILLIYRKDKISFLTFIDELTTLLETIITNTENFYLMGDFNIKVNNIKDPNTQTFLEFLECFDLQNNVTFPTHLYSNTLDLVISRKDDRSLNNFVQGEILADHHAIEFGMKAVVDLKTSKTRKCEVDEKH
jgi:endonuclease/exonuclease/phosphatase family metal-dependent hydrolase